MKSRSIVLTLVCTAILAFSAVAQNTPESLVQQFFETYNKQGSAKALDELYSTNNWIDTDGDAMLNLKNQMAGLTTDYIGKYYGYELIVERTISDSFILQSYIVKFDRQPLRFTFQFYRPDNEWRLQAFQYDANMDDELEESAKLYYMKNE